MHDYHMHYPPGFDPERPRRKNEDGMLCAPGLRKDCPVCQDALYVPQDEPGLVSASPPKPRGRPPKVTVPSD